VNGMAYLANARICHWATTDPPASAGHVSADEGIRVKSVNALNFVTDKGCDQGENFYFLHKKKSLYYKNIYLTKTKENKLKYN